MTPSDGTLYTPNWPLYYPKGASCVWTLNPPPTTIVRFFFTSFELDGDLSCEQDRAPEKGDQISIHGEFQSHLFQISCSWGNSGLLDTATVPDRNKLTGHTLDFLGNAKWNAKGAQNGTLN